MQLALDIGSELQGNLQTQVSLAKYTSWRVGGIADYLYQPKDLSDLSSFLQLIPVALPITWLGLGSNTLIRDGGIRGVVIVTQGLLKNISVLPSGILRAEAGVASAQLARHAARLGLAGLEFLAGIPGTIGGALKMNAGCFKGETWTYVQAVETIDKAGQIHLRASSEFQVSYRHVQMPAPEAYVAGHFALQAGNKEESLAQIRNLLEKRNASQPTGTANCGSVFRNPPGDHAGRLIESCGLKGKRIGGAEVSPKHANFIINTGDALAKDIEALIYYVQATVAATYGVTLIPEVCVLGDEEIAS